MAVMAAVLSSYVFVARSYSRTIGFGLPNQPTLESQGRRTLTYFARDVQAAAGIFTGSSPAAYALSDTKVTLIVPRSNGGTRYVTYYFNNTATAASVSDGTSTVSVPAYALSRIDWSSSTALTLHSSIVASSCTFTCYDTFADIDVTGSARSYTTYVNYLNGIKQIALTLTAQAGSGSNQTLLYRITSPRYALRNKTLLY